MGWLLGAVVVKCVCPKSAASHHLELLANADSETLTQAY